ncbi:MAG TPA: hypothetical protein VGG73_00870 [Vicinamibacterales bacterium]|jgi:hypothetical protein
MTRLFTLAAAFILIGTLAFAHGGFDHVRGVVTQVSAQSITVKVADASTKILTIDEKTTVKKSGKAAAVADIRAGDRVVVDVPEKKTNAVLIQIGVAASTTTHK